MREYAILILILIVSIVILYLFTPNTKQDPYEGLNSISRCLNVDVNGFRNC